MDDLVEYLFNLFKNDVVLQEIFSANGASTVTVGGIGQRRELTTYPKIVIWHINGVQRYTSDNDPTIITAKVKIEVVVRQEHNVCRDAELCRQQITARIYQLISGNQVTPALSGTQVSTQFKVAYIYQCQPTGEVPNLGDPKIVRWVGTYDAMVNQNAVYGLVPSGGNLPQSIIDLLP